MLFAMKNLIFLALWKLFIIVQMSPGKEYPAPPDEFVFQIENPMCGKMLLHLTRINTDLANENLPVMKTITNRELPRYMDVDKDIMKKLGEFAMYHDYETRSAFVYFRKTGTFDGIVDVRFHIKGLHINNLDEVQKVKTTNSKLFDWLLFSKKKLKISRRLRSINNDNTTIIRTRRDNPKKIIYPELLVAISYEMFKDLKKNFLKTIAHVLTVYNAVDMLYAYIECVDIRINIAAIIIEETENYWDFIPRVGDTKTINKPEVNKEISIYFKNHEDYFPRDSYDYIAYNTRCKIAHDDPNRRVHGVSSIPPPDALFPFDNKNLYTRLSLAVTDYKGYESYSTIAHELAHIFSASHDEDDPEYESTPACSRRPSIMASDCTELSLDWSDNTEAELAEFFRSPYSCNLRNYPRSMHPFPRKPRKILTGLEQCKCYGYNSFATPVYYTADICKDPIHCVNSNGQIENDLPLPFDGTPCGENKVCWEESCQDIEITITV